MCGLFGLYSTVITKNDFDVFFDLGIVSSLRGLDSTGIAAAYRTKKNNFIFSVLKDCTDPIGFFHQKATQDRLQKLNRPVALLGHTRSATIGTVSKDNAHPFFHGNIVGMHNGTIPSLKPADGSTDSEELIKRINTMGIQGALDSINGDAAYALAWFNAKTQTLHFLRNRERPLWYMRTVTGQTMIYASEKAFLDLIAARTLAVWKQPQPFDIDKMYTFKLPDMEPCGEEEVRPKPRPFVYAGQTTKTNVGWPASGGGAASVPVIYVPPNDNDPPFEIHKKEGIIPQKWDDPGTYFTKVPIGGYPYKLNVNGVSKLLWYIDYYGNPILPRTMVPILQDGCMISTHKPEMSERICWIAPNVFVMPWHVQDEFIQQLLGENKFKWGGPIYATTASVANFRKLRRSSYLTRKCDDEGAHHEVH